MVRKRLVNRKYVLETVTAIVLPEAVLVLARIS